MADYLLRRSRRKTCAIYIMPDGGVEVRAPLRLPKTVIDAFVRSREGWIQEKTAGQRERLAARAAWTPGEGLLLLGRQYPVCVEAGRKDAAFDGERFLLPAGSWEEQRPAVIALYRRLAQERLLPRLTQWGETTGLLSLQGRISSAATRWGSCSGKGRINLSWRLVLAPPEAVDYVLVHELAHLRQMNHGPAFWALVENILPDYRQRQDLLGKLAGRLARESWREGRENGPEQGEETGQKSGGKHV